MKDWIKTFLIALLAVLATYLYLTVRQQAQAIQLLIQDVSQHQLVLKNQCEAALDRLGFKVIPKAPQPKE